MIHFRKRWFGIFFAIFYGTFVGITWADVTPSMVLTAVAPGVEIVVSGSRIVNISQLDFDKDTSPYCLQPGDQFEVKLNGADVYQQSVEIGHDGKVSLLLLGEVPVNGLTIEGIQKLLAQKFERYMKRPSVSVIPISFGSRRFTILGSVSRPGVYDLHGNTNLVEAIAMAGGARLGSLRNSAAEMADLSRAFLVRNNQYIPVNFQALIEQADMSQNVVLRSGDYVYLPSYLSQEVTFLGDVKRPGNYTYYEGLTLLRLLSVTGGGRPTSKRDEVIILRDSLVSGTVIRVNPEMILKMETKDVLLQPGDIVYLPENIPLPFSDIVQLALQTFVRYTATKVGTRAAQ